MALGFASATSDSLLNAFGNASAYTGTSTPFVKLHTGSPGSAGTSNAAGNTSRQALSFGSSSGGTMANDTALTWTNVSTSETYTHFSVWDASSAGTFLASGSVTGNPVTAGDTFTVAIAGLTASLSVAA